MKKVLTFITSIFMTTTMFAFDLSFRLSPTVLLSQTENMGTGFSGFAQIDADLFGLFTTGIEGNFSISTPNSMENAITFMGVGGGLGAYYSPLARLHLGLGGAVGVYQFNTKIDEKNMVANDIYYRGYGEVGFRFSPNFSLNATAGYIDYMTKNTDPILKGIFAGISAKYTISVGKSGSSSIVLNVNQENPVFPLFMNTYRQNPIASVTLKNNESAEIKNVKVSFRAGKYTSSTFESATFGRIGKYSSQTFDLFANFSNDVLSFSENGKISGEIIVDYELLGKKIQSIQNVSLKLYNRNAFIWNDSDALSAFISSNTPEILEFSKYIAGIARNNFIEGMNRNLQMSIAMIEAMKLSGITYSEDKKTPFVSFINTDNLDSIQYPLQTMNYLSGDYDDLGILLMSCLESVGVSTGYLPLDDDFIVLINLAIKPSAGKNHFADENSLVENEENLFFGLSMANFEKGFTESKRIAAKKILEFKADENNSHYVTNVDEAWQTYPPTTYSGFGNNIKNPKQEEIESIIKKRIQEYKESDLEIVVERARQKGNPNSLGVALVRSGRYSEAKKEFAKSDSISALNNLANVYVIEKNYDLALKTYEKVLSKEPENPIALSNLNALKLKLGL